MNSVKETNGNDSRTWYQDKKIRIRNTRIPDRHGSIQPRVVKSLPSGR